MFDRTYGNTTDCAGCRYWSEMIAESVGCGPIQAACLSQDSPHAGRMVRSDARCDAWKSGDDGAVDEPGSDPLRYERRAA